MMVMMTLFGLGMLAYLYGGYVLLLKVVRGTYRDRHAGDVEEREWPVLTVLVTVHNEGKNIEGRIRNLQACQYPANCLEILVASDGSTDETDSLVERIAAGDDRIRLFRPEDRKGKTDTQNQAIAQATGDIIVFTDADTRFDTHFLQEIARPFFDPNVGGVDGHLLFLTETADRVSRSQGFYWRQELQIRQLESELGIMAVASGACMAIRRSLFRPMRATVGEDCLIPLDVVDQGYRMVHAEKAIAYDRMAHEPGKEFRTRVRMTLRNWQGTWSYPQLLNPFRHPGIAFALWSHKVLRWLSPLFLIMWLAGSVVILLTYSSHAIFIGVPGVIFIFGALAGVLGLPIPGVAMLSSFVLANVGFGMGVIKAMAGKRISTYR